MQDLLKRVLDSKKESGLGTTHNSTGIYKSKGQSTASSEDDQLLKIKLERAYKYIEAFKNNEKSLNNRLADLEKSEVLMKQKIISLKNKEFDREKYIETIVKKLECGSETDFKNNNGNKISTDYDPMPSIIKAQQIELLLSNKNENAVSPLKTSEVF